MLAAVWNSSTPQPTPSLLFKSVENNQHAGNCHSHNHRQHSEDCHKEVSEQLGGSDHKLVVLTLAKQVNTNAGKLLPSCNYKKADWKRFREFTGLYTKSVTFSKHSVSKNSSDFNSAVLKAAKKSILRGRPHDYKPYWNKILEKIYKGLREAREEMERKSTPQNVSRHSKLKVDLDRKTGSNPVKLENENSIP